MSANSEGFSVVFMAFTYGDDVRWTYVGTGRFRIHMSGYAAMGFVAALSKPKYKWGAEDNSVIMVRNEGTSDMEVTVEVSASTGLMDLLDSGYTDIELAFRCYNGSLDKCIVSRIQQDFDYTLGALAD